MNDVNFPTKVGKEILTTTNSETTPELFSDFIRDKLGQMEAGKILTAKRTYFSDDTIRQYRMLQSRWAEFEHQSGIDYRIAHLMPGLVKKFEAHLTAQGLAMNSVTTVLSKLKALLRMAFLEGRHYWNGSGIKCPKELTTKIYLPMDDLKRLTNSETALTETQQKVLDVFVCQCFLGLRYDTLRKFLKQPLAYIKSHYGKNYVDIVSDKTGEQSVVPIGEVVEGILRKYLGSPPVFSEVYVNREIKKIAMIQGLTEAVVIRKTIGGVLSETMAPKYSHISTHTARRTFVSLLKLTGISDREICAMTGHTSEKQLLTYARLSGIDKVKNILGHEFFNMTL